MIASGVPQDLIVLAADLSMQGALKKILQRHAALAIREISCQVILHPMHDSGVLQNGPEFLQAQNRRYRHALAVCDRHGCGREYMTGEQLEGEIEKRLSNHWDDRAAAVVIDPELENWLWADSPHVAKELGWQGGMPELRAWLRDHELLSEGQSKPADPKTALEQVLRFTHRRNSGALHETLASRVSFQRCVDPAFLKLQVTLGRWFPITGVAK